MSRRLAHHILTLTLRLILALGLMGCSSTSVQYSDTDEKRVEATSGTETDGERDSPFQRIPLVADSIAARTPAAQQAIMAPPELLLPELIVLPPSSALHLKLPDDLTQDWLARQSIKLRPGDCRLNYSAVSTDTPARAKNSGLSTESPQQSAFRLVPKNGALEARSPNAQNLGSPLLSSSSIQNKHYSRFVLLSDPKSKMILGVARADGDGRFVCNGLSPAQIVELSTEETLQHESIAQDSPSISFTQEALGRIKLRVESSQAPVKGIKPPSAASQGLLLRIARRTQNSETYNTPTQTAPLSWNWLRNNDEYSLGLRIDSYFQQTFLLGSDLVEIALPAGPYLLAVTNPITNQSCYVTAEVEPGSSSELVCPEKTLLFEEFDSKSVLADDRPILLIPTHAGEDVLGTQLGVIGGSGLRLAELTRSGSSAVIHANLSRSPAAQRAGKMKLEPPAATSDSQKEQIVLDGSFSDFSDVSLEPTHVIEKYLAGTQIPDLVLTSQVTEAAKEEARYFNPLYTQTRLMLSNNRGIAADSIHTSVTNGVIFRWRSIDPRTSLVPMPSDGVLNFEVLIPAYNLTEFIEVHVNGRLKRRIVLGRKNVAEPAVINVEERSNTKSDADVSIFAWGRPFLPEFLYGQSKIAPRALSSRICLDVNKNYICDPIPERQRP